MIHSSGSKDLPDSRTNFSGRFWLSVSSAPHHHRPAIIIASATPGSFPSFHLPTSPPHLSLPLSLPPSLSPPSLLPPAWILSQGQWNALVEPSELPLPWQLCFFSPMVLRDRSSFHQWWHDKCYNYVNSVQPKCFFLISHQTELFATLNPMHSDWELLMFLSQQAFLLLYVVRLFLTFLFLVSCVARFLLSVFLFKYPNACFQM